MSRSEIGAVIDKGAESAGVEALKPLQREAIRTFDFGKAIPLQGHNIQYVSYISSHRLW